MGRITRDSIEEVRRTNDIVDVVNSYVSLNKRGGSFWACCPFHDEKTPSFSVHAVRQTYKCFGCGEFGSVIDFVMKHEKLDFVETIEKLADRSGVRLSYEGGGPMPADRTLRAKALDMMQWAQRGFVANLAKSEPALQYLQSRGLGGEVAERWGIGYAPDEFHRQSDAALKKFDVATVEATGLCKRNERGWYDFFRGRITFPIRDAQQRIVGFGARLLDPDAKAQKYVNSAEGLLFHKSKLLYGIDRLAQSKRLKETNEVLIMEGYTDVIAAHEAGFDNAVAPLGTALTQDQLAILRRYGAGVTLVLDGDEAGLKAAERGRDVALAAQFDDAKVAVITGAKDPFDLLRAHGPSALQAVLENAYPAFEFWLKLVKQDFGGPRPSNVDGIEHAKQALVEMLVHAESDTRRDEYLRRGCSVLGLRESAVIVELEDARSRLKRGEVKPAQKDSRPTDPKLAYEREILRRLFEHPQVLSAAGELVHPELLSSPGLQALYREMLNAWDEHHELVPGALLPQLTDQARLELDAVLEHVSLPGNQSADTDEAGRLLAELKRLAQHEQLERSGVLSLDALRQKKGRKGPRGA